ncbi:hypothetical protein L3X38_010622 [Prunus dulcis]|uniref:Uncharacterized protein n=1 Tax=Prunus dulcis TaxID=3755 RepID=A0AAD4WGJ1_PRUDU|nr:hypothetical protein L3X38_010622 [Prunus dulcis]
MGGDEIRADLEASDALSCQEKERDFDTSLLSKCYELTPVKTSNSCQERDFNISLLFKSYFVSQYPIPARRGVNGQVIII